MMACYVCVDNTLFPTAILINISTYIYNTIRIRGNS